MTGIDLSVDFQVCVKIFEFNNNSEKVWFTKLAKSMELPKSAISVSLDKLFDKGMIDGDWEVIDGAWTRTLKVTGEFRGFVQGLKNVITNGASIR